MSFVTAKVEGFFNSFAPLRLRPRSSVRGPWLTSVFGAVLLIGLPIVIITGLLSFIAYGPQFGQAMPSDVGWLRLPYFQWPTRPSWLYRLTQGLHVGLGLILVPIVLAKLWSVIPKLFVFPPVRTPAQALERWSLIALVGGILFEIITGVLNIQYDYIFGFSFYTAHYWGAWVFIAGFPHPRRHQDPDDGSVPVSALVPHGNAYLSGRHSAGRRRRNWFGGRGNPLRRPSAAGECSRWSAVALCWWGVLSVGQTVGGFLRPAALLLPRGRSYGTGPNDFQINRTASAAQITDDQTGDRWRLTVSGSGPPVEFSRTALLAMSQHSASLPIACVEGWSTTEDWSGVRLRDLAVIAGVPQPDSALVSSLERNGPFSTATLQGNQATDPDALLALRVNGVDLSLDHGYPARIIVPALPGVHNTKWVQSIAFRGA